MEGTTSVQPLPELSQADAAAAAAAAPPAVELNTVKLRLERPDDELEEEKKREESEEEQDDKSALPAATPQSASRHKKGSLIAFVNPNSGGKNGGRVIRELAKLIGKDHVFDLTQGGPEPGLEEFRGTEDLRVVVGGGDGSVNWVLGKINSMEVKCSVGILPMGTGNDTSRQFNWGSKFGGAGASLRRNLEAARANEVVDYDRWHCMIQHEEAVPEKLMQQFPHCLTSMEQRPRFLADSVDGMQPLIETEVGEMSRSGPLLQTEFNNYISFGVDSQIIHNFHHFREKHRGCHCCRLCNMAWMGYWGGMNWMCCQSLKMSIVVETRSGPDAKWQGLVLPKDVRAVVLLNVGTYAGGRNIWGKAKAKPKKNEYVGPAPSCGDGKLEIIGVKSSFHLGTIVLKMARGVRLGQAEEVRVRLGSEKVYVQVDGEPYVETHSTYHMRAFPKSRMVMGDHTGGCCS